MTTTLPEPRPGGAGYSIAVVCLGNICRSPMAAVVLSEKVATAGLAGRVRVVSAGTGDWHLGDPMDRRAAATLAGRGHDPTRHRAAQFGPSWFGEHDAVLTMDAANRRDVEAMAVRPEDGARIRMFRDFDPLAGAEVDVPDPYYGGPEGFDEVYAIVDRATDEILRELRSVLDVRGSG